MPISMTQNNQTYYLHYDQVGTLRLVTDINNNIIKEVTYDTFGNILNDTNTDLQIPFGFADGMHDRDTELVHFGYREYDPFTGKWTAKDPIGFDGGDSNLYGYVLQDPVNFIDPDGLIGKLGSKTVIHGGFGGGDGYGGGGGSGKNYGGGSSKSYDKTCTQKKGTPGNNKAQNKQFADATKGLTKAQKRKIHDFVHICCGYI